MRFGSAALATERVDRKLAAILVADVAGYSRLMGTNEEGTHERLKAHFRQLMIRNSTSTAAGSSRTLVTASSQNFRAWSTRFGVLPRSSARWSTVKPKWSRTGG